MAEGGSIIISSLLSVALRLSWGPPDPYGAGAACPKIGQAAAGGDASRESALGCGTGALVVFGTSGSLQGFELGP